MDDFVRPRLIDYYGIAATQAKLNFAIPFLSEDIPLYLDPFLLWRSPSQQDQSLHEGLLNAFNHLGTLAKSGNRETAIDILVQASECDEVGLGNSSTRTGKRIGRQQAEQILALFQQLPHYAQIGCRHIEEIQLYVDGISKDRISDLSCSFLKSFLIDFTIDECDQLRIPTKEVIVTELYSQRDRRFTPSHRVRLPINPVSGTPIVFVPKRWLRFMPWINFEEYFQSYCPQDDISHKGEPLDRVRVLLYNRDHYGVVETYITEKERSFEDCHNDPLFQQIPIISARRHLAKLGKLPTGNDNGQDREYERILEALLPSLLYPHLDFARAQSRTDSGVSIRDLVFYSNRDHPFLVELYDDYQTRQIPFEMKNVAEVQREHLDQINRYLAPGLGRFGVLTTRHELTNARRKQAIDLWAGQRKAIVTLTDVDIAMMVELFESKQRLPIDVIKKKYFEFRQLCPA
jgi:hypothetical protein